MIRRSPCRCSAPTGASRGSEPACSGVKSEAWYQLEETARVVGIGAGIVGRGVADHPAQMSRRGLPNADGGRSFRAEAWMVSAFGGARGRTDVPRIVDWYMDGKIEIDSLITHTMPLEAINTALDLMHRGESIRSVIYFLGGLEWRP